MKAGYVYVMASGRNGTLYTGSTANLVGRVWQHRNRVVEGFTDEHGCTLLVWFEVHDDLQGARLRERQIKKWNRSWKLRLIEETNPRWDDLYDRIALP
jgi:putative endonuclease